VVLAISIFFLASLWTTFSILFYNFLKKIIKLSSEKKSIFFLSSSLGFITLFSCISSINIVFHFIGITFIYTYLLIPILICIVFFNWKNVQYFYSIIFYKLMNLYKNSIINSDKFINSLVIIIAIQILCLFLRFLLPVTHGDALSQYFYDSLQISRLNNLSIYGFYEMGEYFRTDSLASFYDAFILQISDNWILVRSSRVLALLLVVFNSIEFASNLGNINYKKGVLLAAIILTLPDVWDISLSGKHDGYVLLFELIGIYLMAISVIIKDNYLKIIFSSLSILVAFVSVGTRLSSLTFLLISIFLFSYHVISSPRKIFLKELKRFLSTIPLFINLLIISFLISTFAIAFLNFKYYSNPLYWLSPPGFLKNLFPNADYLLDYEWAKNNLSLNNIPLIFKPVITFLYAVFGVEPIRYGLNKFRESNELFYTLSNYLNIVGPNWMMVSMHSLSSFALLPYLNLENLYNSRKKIIIIFLTFWIFLWTLSIPYTRVAIASSLCLVILAISESSIFKFNLPKKDYLKPFKFFIISYGFISIFLFTFWSFSTLYDLPLKSLLNNNSYNRKNLTRDYILLQNNILGSNDNPPTKKFEEDWSKIENSYPKNTLLFLKAPQKYAYFMDRGLIKSQEKNIRKINLNRKICFELDSNEIVKNPNCQ